MALPSPRALDPESVPALKWGVIGPGDIAGTFVSALHRFTTQRVVAVASRRKDRAEAFAASHGIETVCDSYEHLVSLDEVDVVYIATHIKDHVAQARMVVEAGKHVLVEKPFGYSAGEAKEFFQLARGAGVFATEAMWTRYLPTSDIIRQLQDSGDLGTPEFFTAQFCNDNRHIPRLWEPGSGGIVFDMGIYPIAFAQFLMGNPTSIEATGTVRESGMDEESYVTLGYGDGARAHLIISGTATTPVTASLSTSTALLTVDHPFFVPTGLSLTGKDLYFSGEHWADRSDIHGHDGLSYQANYVAGYIGEGLLESPLHSHDDIVSNLRVAEEICRHIGATPSGALGR